MDIMVVDDEEGVRNFLGTIIKNMDHFCRTAANGEEALDMLEEKTADVIVTDIQMPVMNGIYLLKIVGIQYPQTVVVIMTGSTNFQNAIDAVNFGAYAFIKKPFDLINFRRLIKEIEYMLNRPIKYSKTSRQLIKGYFKLKDAHEKTVTLLEQMVSRRFYNE